MSESVKPLRFKEKKKKRKHDKHSKEHSSKRKHHGPSQANLFDELYEGHQPPSSSHKPDLDWQQHFFDMMAEDEGQDRWDNYFEHRNWRGNGSRIDALNDEEYRQYMVSGMYERKHAAEIEDKKRREEARKARKREREEVRREWEREEAKLRADRKKKQELKRGIHMEQARKAYYSRWEQIRSNRDELNFLSIPWPTVEASEKALGPEAFTASSLREFLILPQATISEQRKSIRQEQLRWHPDKFSQIFDERITNDKERNMAHRVVQSISQALNELWASLSGV
ncbi:hypothetical protein K493DRAFT_311477 [Basidiobolus meristosporus CBS 931.73]|uniref:J domain-containing protein n=1 Tax=Basidiobolus meristosporus CBS 931.73 TaxID=1314790 RepID=A0A1Y1Z2M1_9FUNG|nr:hypothetical protein K493DRAFT_311477 [Basidiobolus meristosporus CBS 931.73]|eukprot:ORY04187.1 hypothetical protein K493DRAFT_311477 [Basidiobolus meristosporus CBS 931.73]